MIKVQKSSIIMLITFIPLLLPDGFYSLLGIPMKARLIFWGLDLVFLFFLLFKRKANLSMQFILLMLIYATIFYSAYKHGELTSVLSNNFCGMVMCVAFEYWLKNQFCKTINFLYYTLFIMIGVNFILLLFFPNGLYVSTYNFTNVTLANRLTYNLNWLFGYKNNQFGYTLPFLALTCIYGYVNKKKVNVFAFLICILSEAMAKATMATVLITICTVTVFFIINGKNSLNTIAKKIYDVRTIIFSTIIVFFSIVLFNSNNYIANIIGHISIFLGKNSNFNNRSAIWEVAINFIKQSPLIGYGNINSEVFIEQSRVLGGTHAHNYILHLLILGGAVCLIEHIFLYLITIKEIEKNKSSIAEIMGIILGLFFVDGITSINFYYPLFNPIFILSFYSIEYYKTLQMKNIAT